VVLNSGLHCPDKAACIFGGDWEIGENTERLPAWLFIVLYLNPDVTQMEQNPVVLMSESSKLLGE